MQFPINLVVGSVVIPSHVVFEILSFIVGFWYYHKLKALKGDTLSEDHRFAVIMAALIGAILGSRLLAFFEHPSIDHWWQIYESKTIVGGLLGGTFAVEVVKKCMGEKRSSGDLFVFPLILAIMVGRIGCLLTGVADGTVGIPSSLPWAFDQGDGIARHPTSLYEIMFLGILFFVLRKVEKRSLKSGQLFQWFMIAYLVFRFFVEFIKPVHAVFLGMSAIQCVSLIGVVYFGWRMKHG